MTLASKLARARTDASQAHTLSKEPLVRVLRPGTLPAGEDEDGVHELGQTTAGELLRIIPVLTGPPGSAFWMSVVGWTISGPEERGQRVWVGTPLADFYCASGHPCKGPAPDNQATPGSRVVAPTETLCDFAAVVGGSLGYGDRPGEIVQHGYGSGAPAVVYLNPRGVQLIQFDFGRVHPSHTIGMNALWGRVS
jgi:hypothetical protein